MGVNKKFVAVGGAAVLLLAVAACGSNRDDSGGSSSSGGGGSFILGTTDSITAVDPAGSYALGDSTLQYSLFQTLVTIPAGQTTAIRSLGRSRLRSSDPARYMVRNPISSCGTTASPTGFRAATMSLAAR